MNDNIKLIRNVLEKMAEFDYILPEDIPNIELYMDQVTTFMDSNLSSYKRYKDDKILTKTMINNYAKNKLLPPPNKKKYSKDHILLLIFIYYLKNILSISDIQVLLEPLSSKYFNDGSVISISEIYNTIKEFEQKEENHLAEENRKKFLEINKFFPDLPDEEREELRLFAYICTLAFDVYVKKQMIEHLIDELKERKTNKEKD
ncbi:hypothetical protein P261_01681 [Lachnospiraceae bacterium TWA4]|nr:hypothetical protein P261_01681 [Lachnospiraceae bacterium TWA4]